jgi:hypothetical protein
LNPIDKYSALRPFTEEERAALLHKPIGFATALEMQKFFDTHPFLENRGSVAERRTIESFAH